MKKGYNFLQILLIIIVTGIVTTIATCVTLSNLFLGKLGLNIKDIANDKKLVEFLNVYKMLDNEYYEDINKEDLMENAITSIAEYLNENYTAFLDPSQSEKLTKQLEGSYEGIGITLKDKTIINVASDSPAANAGLMINDILIGIDDVDLTTSSNVDIATMIKEKKENIKLIVNRDGEILEKIVNVEKIPLPGASYYLMNDNSIGYLDINVFSKGVSKTISDGINYFNENEINSVIIDLRGNSGGYLDEAYKSSQFFLEKGQTVFLLKNKKETNKFKDKTHDKTNFKIIVLVNEQTASAAEVMAAALNENYGAILVGKKTYGKGKVQHTYNLNSGATLKYTTSYWLTPNGNCIDKTGLPVTFEIDNQYIYSDEDPNVIVDLKDNQLNKAIELLN